MCAHEVGHAMKGRWFGNFVVAQGCVAMLILMAFEAYGVGCVIWWAMNRWFN